MGYTRFLVCLFGTKKVKPTATMAKHNKDSKRPQVSNVGVIMRAWKIQETVGIGIINHKRMPEPTRSIYTGLLNRFVTYQHLKSVWRQVDQWMVELR